jgi:hypothetical protein
MLAPPCCLSPHRKRGGPGPGKEAPICQCWPRSRVTSTVSQQQVSSKAGHKGWLAEEMGAGHLASYLCHPLTYWRACSFPALSSCPLPIPWGQEDTGQPLLQPPGPPSKLQAEQEGVASLSTPLPNSQEHYETGTCHPHYTYAKVCTHPKAQPPTVDLIWGTAPGPRRVGGGGRMPAPVPAATSLALPLCHPLSQTLGHKIIGAALHTSQTLQERYRR